MARSSKTDHVKKICGCAKWKECAHPWYVYYREGKEFGPNGKVREKGIRCRLSKLVGREPIDYAEAKAEARRAIVAWKDGRDATNLLPGDAPTLAAVLDSYGERPGGAAITKYQRKAIVTPKINGRPFGEWRAGEVTREMVEAFRRQRPRVSANRDLALLRAAFNWAVLGGLIPSTPFKVGTVSAVKLAREEPRTRRMQGDEETRLREACLPGTGKQGRAIAGDPYLRDLITAALETGCRLGELLSLQWHQVRGDLFLPAGKTKAKKQRRVPISTALRAVLDGRRNDPAGEPLLADAYVFGDQLGRRRAAVRMAWVRACKRAKITGLTFHDLRREAGSRWMDAGVPLRVIQQWLGHHNISQTSTYLAATGGGDAEAMAAYERQIGRLPQIAASTGSDGSQPTPTNIDTTENTQSNTVVH